MSYKNDKSRLKVFELQFNEYLMLYDDFKNLIAALEPFSSPLNRHNLKSFIFAYFQRILETSDDSDSDTAQNDSHIEKVTTNYS